VDVTTMSEWKLCFLAQTVASKALSSVLSERLSRSTQQLNSEASSRAETMRSENTRLGAEVAGLERELALIQRQAYIEQQARQYRLGTPREIPFVIADDAPPLAGDAPGSASVRLGATGDRRSPVDSWLDLLFGPGRDVAGESASGS
jgi:cell division protein FtsB